jgi:hypothetical protein
MLGRIPWKIALLCGAALLAGIVIGPFAAGLAHAQWSSGSQPPVAQAAAAAPAALTAPDSPDAVYTCTPSYIGAFSNRVHVLCTAAAPGGIYYFAAPTSDSKNAARVLSIMLTAKSLGQNLTAERPGAGCKLHPGRLAACDDLRAPPGRGFRALPAADLQLSVAAGSGCAQAARLCRPARAGRISSARTHHAGQRSVGDARKGRPSASGSGVRSAQPRS